MSLLLLFTWPETVPKDLSVSVIGSVSLGIVVNVAHLSNEQLPQLLRPNEGFEQRFVVRAIPVPKKPPSIKDLKSSTSSGGGGSLEIKIEAPEVVEEVPPPTVDGLKNVRGSGGGTKQWDSYWSHRKRCS